MENKLEVSEVLSLPFEPILAHATFDIWPFGLLLFQLHSESPLFAVNRDDDFTEEVYSKR